MIWTFEVWGWGTSTLLIACMYAPSRTSHADAMRVRTWEARDSPQSSRYPALRGYHVHPVRAFLLKLSTNLVSNTRDTWHCLRY